MCSFPLNVLAVLDSWIWYFLTSNFSRFSYVNTSIARRTCVLSISLNFPNNLLLNIIFWMRTYTYKTPKLFYNLLWCCCTSNQSMICQRIWVILFETSFLMTLKLPSLWRPSQRFRPMLKFRVHTHHHLDEHQSSYWTTSHLKHKNNVGCYDYLWSKIK